MWKRRGERCGEQKYINRFEKLFPERAIGQALAVLCLPFGETAERAFGEGVRSFFKMRPHALLALRRHDAEVERSQQEEIRIEQFLELETIRPALLDCSSGLLAGTDGRFENGFGFSGDQDGRVFEQIADAIVA